LGKNQKLNRPWNFLISKREIRFYLKNYIFIIFVIAGSCLLTIALVAANAEYPVKTQVVVDAAQNLGDMPAIFRVGVFENLFEGAIPMAGKKYLQHKYFSDQLPGISTIYVPLLEGDSFDDFKNKVEKDSILLGALEEAKSVLAGGGRVLFDLQMMPSWLSSKPSHKKGEYFRYPPKNYDTWRDLVAFVVDYFYRNGAGDADYRIWEEADVGFTRENKFWYGKPEDFLKLYKSSVDGIRSVDKDAKVTFGMAGYKNEILTAMAAYAAKNNLPLDYIIWHPFRTPPYPHHYSYDVEYVKQALKTAGLKKNIGLHAESWNSWLDFGNPDLRNGWPDERSAERDTEYNAAFAIQTIFALDAGGVEGQSFFSRVDFSYGKLFEAGAIDRSQQFYGDWGMFTRDLVIKPVYNAFSALSILSGKKENQISDRLKALFDETDYITVVASQTKDKNMVRVLIANYIPPQYTEVYNKRKQNIYWNEHYGDKIKPFISCLSKGGPMKECKSQAPQDLQAFLTCIDKNNKDKCSSYMPEHLQQFIQKTSDYMKRQKQEPKEIALLFKNLPFDGNAAFVSYTIDKDHSNSCRYNKRTERKKTGTECGINGDIDTMVTKAREEAEETALRLVRDVPSLSMKKKEIAEDFLYNGKYATPFGKIINSSQSIEQINNDLNVSLEGSRQNREITITKQGTFEDTIRIEPNGVVLMEIRKAKKE
jgi:hypothetical protein